MRLIDADELLTAFPIDNEPMLTKSCVRTTIQHMTTIVPAPHWIPVTERLPENDVDVLVTDWVCNAPWINVDKCGTYDDGTRFWYYTQNPIAWMPLPEPWKGEQNERIDT